MPRALELAGLHAYAEKVVTAGETIHFRTSSTVPYEFSICRLGLTVDDPAGDEVLWTSRQTEPVRQPIHPGSFVHVDKPLAESEPITRLTLECWVRPWRLNAPQTLVSQFTYPAACGYGLFLDGAGRVQFYLGDGGVHRPEGSLDGPALSHREWQHVVGTWDGKMKTLWVNGRRVAEQAFAGQVKGGASPLRLGACGRAGAAVNLLDGDLAMPAIYDGRSRVKRSRLGTGNKASSQPRAASWLAGHSTRSGAIALPTVRLTGVTAGSSTRRLG